MWEFKQIKDLYLRIVAARSDSPPREHRKSLQFVKGLKGVRLNGGVQLVYRN